MLKKLDGKLLLMLANIAKDRPDIISAKEFRKILVEMGLMVENTEYIKTEPV